MTSSINSKINFHSKTVVSTQNFVLIIISRNNSNKCDINNNDNKTVTKMINMKN